MFKKLIFIALVIFTTKVSAQETWSLEKCITQAQQNSRLVKQSQIQIKNAQLAKKQDQLSRYPSVNAGSNLGLNFGRSVNPSTYTFENTTTSFNSWNLNANATLYNGGRINNQIKQSETDVKAAQADLENSAATISLQVAQVYLQILLNDEQLANAKKRIQTTQSQLDRAERQIKAGSIAPTAKYDLVAQVARDEQNIVTASNNLEISYLNLKNLLELSPDLDFKIERPTALVPSGANPDASLFKAVYAQALGSQPQIRAADLRIKSAEIGVKIAEAQLLPTLSVNGNLGSNFSSSILDFTKGKPISNVVNQTVVINGVDQVVGFKQISVTDVPKKPYFEQFGDNFGQSLGLNLSIPIFNGLSRQIGVQRQKLNVESQMLTLEREKQQLKTDVQNAIASARAAKKSYEATQKTFEAQKNAFEATEKRFQIGNANGFELTQAKNNLDTAERDVTVSKYDYIFRLKIVDFYEGKKITLK